MITPCLLFTDINRVEFNQAELREPAENEVLIKTELSAISPGTELRCLRGSEPQLGSSHFPFIPGYALVGQVVRAGKGGEALLGQRVFSSGARETVNRRSAWGGHIGHALVSAVSVLAIPAGVPSTDAVLFKLAAIAYRGVRLATPAKGETVTVVGLGPIGQLSARLFAEAGADVLAVDVATERVALAAQAGLNAVASQGSLVEAVRACRPEGASIVVDATGSTAVLKDSVQLVRDKPWTDADTPGGRLVIQGSYASGIELTPPECFARELTILWPRDSQQADLRAITDLSDQHKLSFDGLLGGVFAPEEAQKIYDQLLNHSPLLTAAFRW